MGFTGGTRVYYGGTVGTRVVHSTKIVNTMDIEYLCIYNNDYSLCPPSAGMGTY